MRKKLSQLFKSVLNDVNTRNLFFFLLLNLFFAFVELTYGLWTNSLGLISDSFHMFFDCSALLLGLAASIVSRRAPNDKFTYGFGRAEILAGLANGLFLLFIALFIMKEAIERTFEPPEVHHERLFIISVLGFFVNLIGIFVFQHGGTCSHSHSHSHSPHSHSHSHDHGGTCSHAHSHSKPINNNHLSQSVSLDMAYNSHNHLDQTSDPLIKDHHEHAHTHSHSHNHTKRSSGRGQIMQSVFLHIVADTLGSVGVMISALLMNQFGWMIADPICSIFIAALIAISVYPLLRDAVYVLMQRTPVELERKLPDFMEKISRIHGVVRVNDANFWTLCSDKYVGCLKLEAAQNSNHRYIMANAQQLLEELGVDQVNIQIDV